MKDLIQMNDEQIETAILRAQLAESVTIPTEQFVKILDHFRLARMSLRQISKFGDVGPGKAAKDALKYIEG